MDAEAKSEAVEPVPTPEPEAPAEVASADPEVAPEPARPDGKRPRGKLGGPKKLGKPSKNQIIIGVIVVLVVLVVFMYIQNRSAQNKLKQLSNPQQLTPAQTKALAGQVGKIYEVPTDETPTIATVLDISKLTGQAFFVHAQNGDKVLLYTKNKLAILYRPTEHKVIQTAPIDSGIQSSAVTPTPTPTPTPKKR